MRSSKRIKEPSRPRPSRKNLIIVRAGDNSLHPGWLAGTAANFDIFVSYYGEIPGKFKDGVQYYESVLGLKWPALANILSSHFDLVETYDAIWFPDDDLRADANVINEMFDLFHTYKLWLAQPALGPGSHVGYSATSQVANSKLRYSGFVEIMCPIFSRDALELLAPTFQLSASGWGLDFLWAYILNYPKERIAILDATPVIHTRKMRSGLFYDRCREMKINPQAELVELMRRYDLKWQSNPPVYGMIPLNAEQGERSGSNVAADPSSPEPGANYFVPRKLNHLINYPETDALGPIQRDEALFLFGIIRSIRPSLVVEFGFGEGYSALNALKALEGNGKLYSYDVSNGSAALAAQNFHQFKNFTFVCKSQENFSPDDVDGQSIDFLFFDTATDLESCQKAFAAVLPSLSPEAIIAIHNTGTWRRGHFLPIHGYFQQARPTQWLNIEEFQHRVDARDFSNWIANNYADFQVMHFHASNCIRHGITLVQRERLLPTTFDGVKVPPNDVRLPGVNEAVCINLPRRRDRWTAFQARALAAGLGFVKRFTAIDGADLNVPPELISHKGTYGCLHSHAAVFREALKKSNTTNILLFEDDCVFDSETARITDYLAATVGNFSWIHLGGTTQCNPHPIFYYPTHIQVAAILNTHAYVIDRQLMVAYVEWLDQNPFPKNHLLHADRLLLDLCRNNSLKICIPTKPLAWQDKSKAGDVQWGIPEPETRTKE